MIVLALGLLFSLQAPDTAPRPLPAHFQELLEMGRGPISTYLPLRYAPPGDRADTQTLYLNRFGDAYSCGDDDSLTNHSSVACSTDDGIANIDAFSYGDAAWDEVVQCVSELFSPFALHVTDQEPLEPGYIEASVGGTPDQAGMGNGVGGVSPFSPTCGLIPGAVVYIFSGVYGNDARAICETAAQEIAHAFGLDHELLCEDPMTYLDGCGDKSFRDAWAPCGEYQPRACACGDETQNSVQWMTEMFGRSDGVAVEPVVDAAPPTVQFLTPASDGIAPANSELKVAVEATDDAGLTVVELEWDFSGERMFCPSDGAAYSCVHEGGAYTWTISVGVGMRAFRVRVRDVAGNEAFTEDRRVWFSPDGQGPPADEVAPTIILGAPLPDAFVPDSEPVRVVASMLDDSGIARAEIDWQSRYGLRTIGCPFESERFSCVQDGATSTWTFSPREGQRSFRLRAVDLLGNMAETDFVDFTVDPTAPPVVLDGNDSFEQAIRIACGDELVRDGNDTDWFRLDAQTGATVELLSNNPKVSLVVTDGAQLLASGEAALQLVADERALYVAATPSSATDGGYHLSVRCEAPPVPDDDSPAPQPESCASPALPSSVAALLALLRRRAR